ncbi:MAG TPA: hypothetical protein PLA85_00165 [Micropepsaceae bacterium]|nr:hypothetical protein [Micropepsaceae bacterium]
MKAASTVLAIAFALLAAPSSTAQDVEMRWRVTGVAENDVLNIRTSPSADSEIAGAIPFNSVSVFSTGEEKTVGSTSWLNTISPYGYGWVNAKFLEPFDAAEIMPDENLSLPLSCGGTEPFWSADISENSVRVTTPEHEAGFDIQRDGPLIRRGAAGWDIRIKGASSIILLETWECSDGMSETVYRYEYDDGGLKGCCGALP